MSGLRRGTELYLLLLCEVFLALGLLSLSHYAGGGARAQLILATQFGLVFVTAHVGLLFLAPDCDQLLLPLTALLAAFGILFVTRLQPDLASRQLVWLAVGVGLLLITIGPLRAFSRLRNYQFLAAFLGMALMLVTAVVGKEINGSRLWLGAGGFYFQVTEAMKLLLVLFLAGYLADRRLMLSTLSTRWRALQVPTLPYLVPLAAIWVLTFGLMAWQHDLGAMLLLAVGVNLYIKNYASTRR